ncbi:hypothetical protein TNCV_127771 [Trichonephila clavipes]|nr:hypothetical protein TNCV_127771 [Trichonephila clavipes]
MERLTGIELADMHLIFGLAEGNAPVEERLYRESYPQRGVLVRRMFTNLHLNWCDYGSLRGNMHCEGGLRYLTHFVQYLSCFDYHDGNSSHSRLDITKLLTS